MNGNQVIQKKTNIRYFILAMLFIVTTFNYVDRATLSIAAPIMSKDLGFNAVTMGMAFSAFGWAYTALQIPGGWVLDKYGARVVYGSGLFLWSLFTALQGTIGFFAGSAFAMLFGLRFLMGIAEAPAFPANARITAMWFPTHERGFASAIFNSAQYFALAVFTPLMAWTLHAFGWHYIFYWTGAAGIIISVFWFKVIRDPKNHSGVNQAEMDYIEAGGGLASLGDKKTPIKWNYVRALIQNRQMIGIYLGQFCLNTITWFFLTWFPTYLVQAKGMSMLKVGLVASIPAIAGFAGGVLGGYWSDWLLRRGKSLTVARKTPIIIGLVFSSSIILANYVDSTVLVVVVMSLAFFSKGIGALGWCVVGDTSPKEMVGVSGGIFNMVGNLASIVTPLVIGYILDVTKSFNGALIFVGIMGLLGAMSYLFIVGDIHRMELKTEKD
ncbi:putative glucarate transporter [Sporomusa silvacetica DSM 10669]|uniref:Glucarate transporter n=1 Tax=Sporomusa silvacetica DSM 10669 TaxID=1123289 RepID=A0ABZ3IUM4_9FIRM|nr:MFS transporter [Sporomusa silvacetica]OZC12956.1 putative glucarate transporter [Sporomusa silvacetica DSM 10669]